MADHHRAELVVDAPDMTRGGGGLEPGCVIRSDRGSEYTSTQFRNRTGSAGCGRAADAPDHTSTTPPRRASGEIGTRTWRDRATARAEVFTFIGPSTTAADCASPRPSAISPQSRPGSGISTPSRHNDHVSEITGKLHLLGWEGVLPLWVVRTVVAEPLSATVPALAAVRSDECDGGRPDELSR
ncbi:hypothetical protein [Streptomyces chartreusis]